MITKEEQLACAVERALADYHGVDSEQELGREWTVIACAFAKMIDRTQVGKTEGYWAASDAAKLFGAAHAELTDALVAIVE